MIREFRQRKLAAICLATLMAGVLPLPAAAAQAPQIDHDPVQCIVAGSFPELEAAFAPASSVASARAYFKAADTPDWYWVPFTIGEGGKGKAVLPKPQPSLRQIDYYLSALDDAGNPVNGPQYHPIVSTKTYCENQALTVAQAVDTEAIELTVGLVRLAQQVIPSGFFSQGIATTVLANGSAVATSAAAQSASTATASAGTSSTTAASSGTAAAAGGGHAAAWVIGGLAVAGAGAYAVTSSQKEEEDKSRPVTVTVSDYNRLRDSVYDCYANGSYLGRVDLPVGGSVNFSATLTKGTNTIELRFVRAGGGSTGLQISVNPGGLSTIVAGDQNHTWTFDLR